MAVVLHTTHGDLPVLLHYQACPKASYNFLALCASGYYDGCAFYRHMPNVLLQSGDPTNTGKGGASIFAQLPSSSTMTTTAVTTRSNDASAATASRAATRAPDMADNTSDDKDDDNDDDDVTHTLLSTVTTASRFFDDEGFGVTTHNARGVLSMAHAGTRANTNASQFFITCQPVPAFDRVYTAFGAVVLAGCYDAATARIVPATAHGRTAHVADDDGDDDDVAAEATASRCGDAVLRALERAAVCDARHRVVAVGDDNDVAVAIRGATVVYNPFAEGRMRV